MNNTLLKSETAGLKKNQRGRISQQRHIKLSIGYITRRRSLRDLHTEDRRPRGCVNHVETEPSDTTDLYHGALPQRRIFIIATIANYNNIII